MSDQIKVKQILSPSDVADEFGIPTSTQAVWRYAKKHGFHNLTIKLGASVRYRRADLECWIEAHREVPREG